MACALGLGLTSCSNVMVLSHPILESQGQTQEMGAIYRLPKTVVTLTITLMGSVREEPRKCAAPYTPKECSEFKNDTELVPEPKYISLDSVATREVADTQTSFSLQYDRSVVSNDRVCMAVSTAGLLQAVEGAADDKTGDIVVAIAKLAGRILGPGAFAAANARKADNLTTELARMTIEIDPLDERHWDMVNQAMVQRFGPFAASYRFRVEDIKNLVGTARIETCPLNSVCYRTRVPANFTISKLETTRGGATQRRVTSSIFQDVVSRRVTGHVDVSRALMVEKITKLTFKDGILVGVNIRKPSEGLAVAKLPLTVLDAITTSALSAPGDFFAKFTGNNPAAVNDLITKAAANEAKIAELSESLKKVREADYTTGGGFEAEKGDALTVKCAIPTVAGGKT